MVSGSGTSQSPYMLYTFADLELVGSGGSYGTDKYYKLANDIDASSTADPSYNSGAGWLPRECANFNGNGYTISGLFINRPSTDNVGLLGLVFANVSNLTLSNVNITGRDNVGAIVGRQGNGIISLCNVTGYINGRSYVGGILGFAEWQAYTDKQINGCAVNVTVNCTSNGGLLWGRAEMGSTTDCSITGTIIGTGDYIGGVVGFQVMDSTRNTITDVSVTGNNYVGGLSGHFKSGNITYTDVTGTITGNDYVGGINGNSESGNYTVHHVTHCDINVTVNCHSYGGLISGAMGGDGTRDTTTVNGTINATGSYIGGCFGIIYGNADGFIIDDVVINAPNSDRVGGICGVHSSGEINDCAVSIDITAHDYVGGICGQTTGGSYTAHYFDNCTYRGTISGNSSVGAYVGDFHSNDGRIINSNVLGVVNGTGNNIGGFCGIVDGVVLLTSGNLGVTVNASATSDSVGGYVGWADGVTITNMKNYINVTGRDYVGGFIGYLDRWNGKNLQYLENTGTITGRNSVGGIIGHIAGGTGLSYCYSTGTINSTGDSAGGVVGRMGGGGIYDCYSRSTVNGNRYVGGVLGYADWMGDGLVRCYNSGPVTGNTEIGGLLGHNQYSGSGSNSFWDTQTSGRSQSAMGTGKTTVEMLTTSTYTTWDFTNTWIREDSFNDGYPYLKNGVYSKVIIFSGAGIEDTVNIGSLEIALDAQGSYPQDLEVWKMKGFVKERKGYHNY